MRELPISLHQGEYSRRLIARGYAEGFAEGFAEALAEGLCEGLGKGLCFFLETRGIALSESDLRRVAACDDVEQLKAWLRNAVDATCAQDVFG